ncbi:hypothetical protein C5F47_08970 [Nitrosopumilus cobalaminigenes]|uniref:Uncharacterized protein n=1 Tax=Nitrosopumilus cobalaminigenes TaxID=1470066 RepID=A0A7D5R3F6_9ARCH|nr:hypothetical protein C5F47_08970 [Nitrosopumilus cobalaminigenes]
MLIGNFSNSNSFATSIDLENKIILINNSIGIQKSIIQMNISHKNNFSWDFIEETIENHVLINPVII